MKRLLTYFNQRLYLGIKLLVLFVFFSNQSNAFELIEETDSIDVWTLTVEENIKYPLIPCDVATTICENILCQYKHLKQLGYDVRLVRSNEVIKVTISIDDIFRPNVNDQISPNGIKLLSSFIPFFRIKEMYRVILLLHHDNSISSNDADYITNERVLTLSEWFIEKSNNAKSLIPYSMGSDYPIISDTSKIAQKKNRRLEMFILPGQTIIDLAKDNKLCNFVEK